MNTSIQSRSHYWDLVKGIGIIAIVLGHSCYFAAGFVYLFHLALFFFISGYLYNETKYGDAPFSFFCSRLTGVWPRYIFYTSCFVLLHNFFVTRGLYQNQELYNHTKTLAQICTNISFTGAEPVQGALWFVPTWLIASSLFGGTVWFGRAFSERLKKPALKLWLTGSACALIGAAGVLLNMKQVAIFFQVQASMTVVPLYFFAYLLRLNLPGFKKYATWYGCIISAYILYYLTARMRISILLDEGKIPGAWFYLISLIGIYFCLALAALIEKSKAASRLISLLGRCSFEIMALHFAVFKLVDYAYAKFWLQSVPENLNSFPISFSHELWPVYLIAGTMIPALIWRLSTRISRFLFSAAS